MCDFTDVHPRLCECLLASIDGKAYAFLVEIIVELEDTGGGRSVDERMLGVADGGTCLNSGKTIDGEDLLETVSPFISICFDRMILEIEQDGLTLWSQDSDVWRRPRAHQDQLYTEDTQHQCPVLISSDLV